jgi:hypothetical protein
MASDFLRDRHDYDRAVCRRLGWSAVMLWFTFTLVAYALVMLAWLESRRSEDGSNMLTRSVAEVRETRPVRGLVGLCRAFREAVNTAVSMAMTVAIFIVLAVLTIVLYQLFG